MKKSEFDERVAEKSGQIQNKIDLIISHIMDKQFVMMEFIEKDPRRSVDVSLDHLVELIANYAPKYETENEQSARKIAEQHLDVLSLISDESSPSSSPEPSQELESVKTLIQTGARKMSERVAGIKNLWASFSSGVATSNQNQNTYEDIRWSSEMTDGLEINGRSLIKSGGIQTPEFG